MADEYPVTVGRLSGARMDEVCYQLSELYPGYVFEWDGHRETGFAAWRVCEANGSKKVLYRCKRRTELRAFLEGLWMGEQR